MYSQTSYRLDLSILAQSMLFNLTKILTFHGWISNPLEITFQSKENRWKRIK